MDPSEQGVDAVTAEEVEIVAGIMITADDTCRRCASNLVKQLFDVVPEHREAINRAWTKEWEANSWENY